MARKVGIPSVMGRWAKFASPHIDMLENEAALRDKNAPIRGRIRVKQEKEAMWEPTEHRKVSFQQLKATKAQRKKTVFCFIIPIFLHEEEHLVKVKKFL